VLTGGEGKEGEEQEETSGYLMVASVEVGGGRMGALRRAGAPAVAVGAGGCGPAALGGGERVGEHWWRAWYLLGGSVREDGGRRRGLHGSRAVAAMEDGGGGAPTVLGSRDLAVGLHGEAGMRFGSGWGGTGSSVRRRPRQRPWRAARVDDGVAWRRRLG